MYTYWKRAVNPPRQIIFDSGGREACDVSRRVTNTPLQALVLMNDVTFLEAARHLAEQTLKQHPEKPNRLSAIYRRATSRKLDEKAFAVLDGNLTWFLEHYKNNPEAAEKFLTIGDTTRDEAIPVVEHAAYAAVAHLILNLDEAISLE